MLCRMFAQQHETSAGVSQALDGLEAVWQQTKQIQQKADEATQVATWVTVGGFVLTGLGLVYAGAKAGAAEDMAFRAAKASRDMRQSVADLDNKIDKTNARMDAMNDKVSYGFKTVLGVGEPKH